MKSVSVVIPVKDGARFLRETCAAVLAQGVDELLVIDSGSTDLSQAIAREAGARVLEIEPREFGHGLTRNLGVERTNGELVCFLTQDATPVDGWLAAYREAFDLADHVGAAYGPQLPRPETSPMIARELVEFFAGHAQAGGPSVQAEGGLTYLSNVNACYLRDCWQELRFPDVRYSEDQAFGSAMLAAGWRKVFHPGAAVLHAHDYSPGDFMRRYFDEYRGLRETIGHVEGFGLRSSAAVVRGSVAGDRRWMREQGWSARRRASGTARATLHHAGRAVFAALGSRAHAMPPSVQRSISLEGSVGAEDPGPVAAKRTPLPGGQRRPAGGPSAYTPMLRVARDGAVPLVDAIPGMAERERLHIAVLIPPFGRGSGGHNSIFQMLSRLSRRHSMSIWLHDPDFHQGGEWPAVIAENISEFFAPLDAPVFKGFDRWFGADVAVATGWQTVNPLLGLDQTRARAYLVHDHESEFYATSAESYWAEQTYSAGMHAIAASPWLVELIEGRYGGTTSSFDFGVDHAVYHPRAITRRRDTIMFYGRAVTPRRAVPLGILALAELHLRRPHVRIQIFGDARPLDTPFPHEHIGVASPEQLSWAYSQATAGLCLSMTNYSLVPQEMLACGLPCIDLAGFSAEGVFGADGPVELAPFDPIQLADAMERLLDDAPLAARRSAAGLEFVRGRTWDRAAAQLEHGLREALRLRELEFAAHDVDADGYPSRPPFVMPNAAPPAGFDASARTVPVDVVNEQPVTDRISSRLDPNDVLAVEERLDGEEREHWELADARYRFRLALIYGVAHEVPAILRKTGLSTAVPPDSVHAMARGSLAAGGAFAEADMIVGAYEAADGSMATVRSALDFGCSSGRLVRAMAAAWPDIAWHGSDPNERAIAWAQENLPMASFVRSETDPPLPFDDGALDLVYAVSIWSHFGELASVQWFDEMHRVLAPGGHLVFTAHGYQSVAHDARTGRRPPRNLEQIRRALYRRGFWFDAEFGPAGDDGVHHPEWGFSYMTAEWLLRNVRGKWAVVHYGVGSNQSNQDLIVMRRR